MIESEGLHVIKRDGRKQRLLLDKITSRIENLSYNLDRKYVDPPRITLEVVRGIVNGITTVELDEYAANCASDLAADHPDYGILAARIAISNLQKSTSKVFTEVIEQLYRHRDENTGKPKPLIADDVYQIIMENSDRLNSSVVHSRDFGYSYFGFRTLERAYLLRINKKIVERPQFMLMRVSVGIHKNDIDSVIETYNLLSEKYFTHATPTLFNAGTPVPQLSSCYLLTMVDDSIEGIYTTLKRCALISKVSGGIGLNIHCIRGRGSEIAGTPGAATGIVPMLKNFNATASYVNQGGKRPGAFAMYLEPWHSDIFAFVQLRINSGPEDVRCRDLFLALWIPDLFMHRVDTDDYWCLMSPNECPGLEDCWGEEFEKLYNSYETSGRYRKRIKARELWRVIVNAQAETGLPYMLYKDACNRKSNQQNLGTIKCSNLCTEIVEYSSPDEVAVCNLASIALNRYVIFKKDDDGVNVADGYDFEKLRQVTKVVCRNLNKIVDVNFYPIPEAKLSNLRHRPIGIGVQGLADTFMLLRHPFTSDEARLLNKQIFETIYFAALEASCELAAQFGPYETYQGSPVSKGILQHDMWNVKSTMDWDWDGLRKKIAQHGVRNSLLVAPMPTASTAQILGNNEAFEPYTANIYTRRVTKGDFHVINQHMVKDLIGIGKWNKTILNQIISNSGSVQKLDIPDKLKELYRTVWEIRQTHLIEMAADRGAFIDQSQSLNLFVESPSLGKCTTMHFKAWKLGLKTGMYYLRSRPSVDPIKFTVVKRVAEEATERTEETEDVPPAKQSKNSEENQENQPMEDENKENVDQNKQVVHRPALALRQETVMAVHDEEDEGCLMCSG